MIALIVLDGLSLIIGALIGLTVLTITIARVPVRKRKASSSRRTRAAFDDVMNLPEDEAFQRIASGGRFDTRFDR